MNSDIISKSILDEIEDVVYISNPETHELYYINAMLKRTLGNPSEEEWRRKKCYKVLQGRDEPCPFCTNHLIKHEGFYNWEHYNTLLEQYFYVQDKLVNFEGIEARLEIAKDITARKLLEQDLSKRLAQEQVINSCIALLHTMDVPQVSIQKLLGLVANYYEAERGYIFLLSNDNQVVDNSHEWCATGVIPQIDILQNVDASIVSHWFDKYREVGEFYIDSLAEDIDHDSMEYEILAMQEIDSLVTAPLYNVDGTFKGFIGVDNPRANIKETTVIRSVSSFVADFLDKSKQLQILHKISYFDNLTDLRNRHSYSLKIAELTQNAPSTLGVIYIDINGLKSVNDRYGHREGDLYITTLGDFLNEIFGEQAYRIGGDEFVVICPDLDKAVFVDKMQALNTFIFKDEFPCAAVGHSWREYGCHITEQIEMADRIMYQNKEEQYAQFAGKSDLFRRKYLLDAAHHLDIGDGR